jgi:1,4-dihydroxy-2-naphthoate polyprenyltransferase
VASLAQWIEGARPRTIPNAVAPVIAGTGAAAWLHSAVWWKALLALLVAVTMVIGVNFANDYSDGIRGTDDERTGPVRLVGSRLAAPRSVLAAATLSMVIAAAAGVVLALASAPWLMGVGVACIAGAWLYTGGSRPYGYRGLGEVAVFVFFGLVAVLGTQYVQALRIDWVGVVLAVATGSLSSAVSPPTPEAARSRWRSGSAMLAPGCSIRHYWRPQAWRRCRWWPPRRGAQRVSPRRRSRCGRPLRCGAAAAGAS